MDRDNILATIKILDPNIEGTYSDEQIFLYIDMASSIVAVEGSNLSVPEQEIATAFLVLSYFSVSTSAYSLAKKKVRDVEVTYADFSGESGANRWKKLYDDMISGKTNSDMSVHYKGV